MAPLPLLPRLLLLLPLLLLLSLPSTNSHPLPTLRSATCPEILPPPQIPTTPRIINGDPTPLDPAHFTLLLFSPTNPTTSTRRRCTAGRISLHWALTVAHCLVNTTWTASVPPSTDPITIERVIPHPNYNEVTDRPYDLALLYLPSPPPLAIPLLVNSNPLVPQDASFIRVHGYGDTSVSRTLSLRQQSSSEVLRHVDLPVVPFDSCQSAYETVPDTGTLVSDRQLCAGYLNSGGCDSCTGDSGGPLIQYDPDNNPVLVAMVSSGRGCALPGFPGINVRVNPYVEWMTDMGAEFDTTNNAVQVKLGDSLPLEPQQPPETPTPSVTPTPSATASATPDPSQSATPIPSVAVVVPPGEDGGDGSGDENDSGGNDDQEENDNGGGSAEDDGNEDSGGDENNEDETNTSGDDTTGEEGSDGSGEDDVDGVGSGSEAGEGSETGDGSDGGSGSEAGDGNDGGSGSEAGDGSDEGSGSEAGDGSDGGSGSEAGDGSDGESAPADEGGDSAIDGAADAGGADGGATGEESGDGGVVGPAASVSPKPVALDETQGGDVEFEEEAVGTEMEASPGVNEVVGNIGGEGDFVESSAGGGTRLAGIIGGSLAGVVVIVGVVVVIVYWRRR